MPGDWNSVLEVEVDESAVGQWRWEQGVDLGTNKGQTWGWHIPANILNTIGTTRLLEIPRSILSETEIQDVLRNHEKHLREQGRVGEDLEEAMRQFQGELRRWEPDYAELDGMS